MYEYQGLNMLHYISQFIPMCFISQCRIKGTICSE